MEKLVFYKYIIFLGPADGCGGTFNLTSTKTIRTRDINGIGDCQWKFVAPVDYTIQFEIADFDIPKCKTGKCPCSFLEVSCIHSLIIILLIILELITSSLYIYTKIS